MDGGTFCLLEMLGPEEFLQAYTQSATHASWNIAMSSTAVGTPVIKGFSSPADFAVATTSGSDGPCATTRNSSLLRATQSSTGMPRNSSGSYNRFHFTPATLRFSTDDRRSP